MVLSEALIHRADKEGVDIDSEENNVFTRGKNNVTSKETYYQYIEAMKKTIENLDINISNIDKNFISLQDDDDFEQVKIGKFVIVGTNTAILPDVTIGEGVAIAANSLITKDLEPWGIYVGNKKVGMRNKEEVLKNYEKFLATSENERVGSLFK